MWEESQQRHKAAVILGSWEMVTWYGIAGDEVRFQIVSSLLFRTLSPDIISLIRASGVAKVY